MSGLDARARRAGAALRAATAEVRPRRHPEVRSGVRNGLVAAGVGVLIAAVLVPLLVLRGGTPGREVQASAAYTVPATTPETRAGTALAILDELRSGDYADIRRGFDATMAAELSVARLAAGWEQFVSQFGSFRSHGTPTETQANGLWVIRVPLTMSQLPGELRVAYDSSGHIAGLFLLRPGIPLGPAASTPVQPNVITDRAAQAVLSDLVRGDFAAVEVSFEPAMKAAVSQSRVQSSWQQLKGLLGPYMGSGTAVVVPVPTAVLYDFPLQFSGGPAHMQVTIDSAGRVAGLYLKTGPPTGSFGQ